MTTSDKITLMVTVCKITSSDLLTTVDLAKVGGSNKNALSIWKASTWVEHNSHRCKINYIVNKSLQGRMINHSNISFTYICKFSHFSPNNSL